MRLLQPGQFLRVLIDAAGLDDEFVTPLVRGTKVTYVKPATLTCRLSDGDLVDIHVNSLDFEEQE